MKHRLCAAFSAITIIALAGVVATACSHVPPETPFPIDTSFSSQQPCVPPCWHNLVPGQSTGLQVDTTLASLPFVAGTRVYSYRQDYDEVVRTTWFCLDGTDCGLVQTSNDTLVLVVLFFQYEVTLEDAVTLLGTPSRIGYGPYHPEAGGCELMVEWQASGVGVYFVDTDSSDVCDALDAGGHPPRGLPLLDATYMIPGQTLSCYFCVPWQGFE